MRVYLATVFISLVFVQQILLAEELPVRKAGLWEISVTSEGVGQGVHSTKQCIDEKTDAEMQKMAAAFGENCSKKETRKEGASYIMESECNMMGSNIKSKAVFQGDFSANYSGTASASYEPPLMGRKDSKTQISARYLGACEAGQKPGDMVMSNGMKMNLNDIMKGGHPKLPK